MTETKFTPGPWHVGINDKADVFSSEETLVARALGSRSASDHVHLYNSQINDAHLIAAAPELYEALYWLAQEEMPYPIGQPYQHWLDKARAALAKARGERTP